MPVANDELSEREQEILRLLATGASNKEIAQQLFISTNTVKVHLRNIFAKTNASSRTEAAMFAVNAGLVSGMPQTQPVETEMQTERIGSEQETQLAGRPVFRGNALWVGIGFFAFMLISAIVSMVFLYRQPLATNSTAAAATTELPRWKTLAPMPTPRSGLAVTAYEGYIYTIGGRTRQEITNIVERYHPETNTWETAAPKLAAVYDINAVVIGGKVYVSGGRLPSGKVTNNLEIYNPRQDSWTQGAPLPVALSAYALAAFEGRIYLFGGWDGAKFLTSVYSYDPVQDAWSLVASMPAERGYLGAAVAGRNIYVVGGYDGQKALSDNQVFQPDLVGSPGGPWIAGKSMPEGRYAMGVTSVADIIYIIGGIGQAERKYTALAYLGQTDEWQLLEAQSINLGAYLGLTNLGTYLYAMGGLIGEAPSQETLAYQAVFTVSFPIIIR
jgi:DNA-binding CsgD family transcriptional regulator